MIPEPNHPVDPERLYIITVSGGKDSTAVWTYLAKDLQLPHIVAVFADTGHEADVTYTYLDYLQGQLGPLHVVTGRMSQLRKDLPDDEPMTMRRLCMHKQRFPSVKARFCTTELKLKTAQAFHRPVCRPESDYGKWRASG